MVSTAPSAYQAVSQDDRTGPEFTVAPQRSPSPSSFPRPAIYFGDGRFSPPSSSEDLSADTEKFRRGHAFLDDEDEEDVYHDTPGSPSSFMESGVRPKQPVSLKSPLVVLSEFSSVCSIAYSSQSVTLSTGGVDCGGCNDWPFRCSFV